MRVAAALLLFCLWNSTACADTLRLATFNTELSRKGPGLLLRDLTRDDPQVSAVVETILAAEPDVLVLQGIDWDFESKALQALQARLSESGLDYAHTFTARPNAGIASGRDLDGDGRLGEPEDAWGWGRFSGQGGMVILSRLPIEKAQARDLTDLLWRTLPEHRMPTHPDGSAFPDPETAALQPLSSVNHWLVPLRLPDGRLLPILTFHAAPPVFDGPEDRNGRRNADEILLWLHLLEGHFGSVPQPPFVLLGDANNDPERGEGHKDALLRLLKDPRLQEVKPTDSEGNSHTALWERTGPMRVDYILPSVGVEITASGILRTKASRHGLVWIDIRP